MVVASVLSNNCPKSSNRIVVRAQGGGEHSLVQLPGQVRVEQANPILGEQGNVPDGIIDGEPDETS